MSLFTGNFMAIDNFLEIKSSQLMGVNLNFVYKEKKTL